MSKLGFSVMAVLVLASCTGESGNETVTVQVQGQPDMASASEVSSACDATVTEEDGQSRLGTQDTSTSPIKELQALEMGEYRVEIYAMSLDTEYEVPGKDTSFCAVSMFNGIIHFSYPVSYACVEDASGTLVCIGERIMLETVDRCVGRGVREVGQDDLFAKFILHMVCRAFNPTNMQYLYEYGFSYHITHLAAP